MNVLAFFNNKGGVGKTTLSCNYAHYAAVSDDKKVLMIDLDPQANATQLVLSDESWVSLYENRPDSESKTILKAFSHILEGDSSVDRDLHIQTSDTFQIDVLAGHPSLSKVEDLLSRAWGDLRSSQIGGARSSNWLYTLTRSLDYDLIILDMGPSLGALNRSALIGSDKFATPVAADLFSLYALDNIGSWIDSWAKQYNDSMSRLLEENEGSESLGRLPKEADIVNGYLGYTVQQYVAKSQGGEIRKTKAYDTYKDQIPERAESLRRGSGLTSADINLGIVPNMFAMIPMAQTSHKPIAKLTKEDGLRGSQFHQLGKYNDSMEKIFTSITSNLEAK